MAASTSCKTTPCPPTAAAAGYRFEPTGTYRPYSMTPFDIEMNLAGTNTLGYPIDMMTPYGFPLATKTYSSIFGRPDITSPMVAPTTPIIPPMMTPAGAYPTMVPTEACYNWPAWCPPTAAGYPTSAFPSFYPNGYPTMYPNMYPTAFPNTWERSIRNCEWPMTFPSTWGYPTMTTPFAPTWTRSSPSGVWTPFERILSRFMAAFENMALPRSSEWLSSISSRPCNAIEFYCLTNPIRVLDREGNRELCLCFDLRGYKPEEIHVTLNKTERCILVEACHDVKEAKDHHVTRKYSRKFIFPESLAKIDLSKIEVKSCFSPEGYLVIECVLPRMTSEEIAKIPEVERFFTSPLVRDTVCPSILTTPVNTKPVNVKIC